MNRFSTQSESSGRIARRTVLAGVAGSMASLAGCSGGDSSSGTDDSDTNTDPSSSTTNPSINVIEEISVNKDTVSVSIINADKADALQVVDPEGRMADNKEIADTVTTVSVDIGTGVYVPGKFEFLAVRKQNGDTIELDSATHEISPQIEITRVAASGELDDETKNEYEGDRALFEEGSIYAQVTNTGTGPTHLTGIDVQGHVPKESGDQNFGKGEGEEFMLYPGDEIMVKTHRMILRHDYQEYYPSEGSVSVTITTSIGENVTQVREITYGEDNGSVKVGALDQEIRE